MSLVMVVCWTVCFEYFTPASGYSSSFSPIAVLLDTYAFFSFIFQSIFSAKRLSWGACWSVQPHGGAGSILIASPYILNSCYPLGAHSWFACRFPLASRLIGSLLDSRWVVLGYLVMPWYAQSGSGFKPTHSWQLRTCPWLCHAMHPATFIESHWYD